MDCPLQVLLVEGEVVEVGSSLRDYLMWHVREITPLHPLEEDVLPREIVVVGAGS
jgi:hypothetical protein